MSWTAAVHGSGDVPRPRVGYLCSYTPVEIVSAAGLQPVRLLNADGAEGARGFLPATVCPYLKGCFGSALTMSHGSLDGVVVALGCDGLRRVADLWSSYLPGFVYRLDVPRHSTEAAVRFLRTQFLQLARFLAERHGLPASDDALNEAIVQYNETRRLLADLDDMRQDGLCLPAKEMPDVIERAFGEPPSRFNPWLQEYIAQLHGPVSSDNRIPLVVAGNVLAVADRKILQLVEEAGARVAGDNLCGGMRGALGETPPSKDPYEALARRYLQRVPCPRMADLPDRFSDLVNLCRRTGARGVLYLSQKFCDLSLHEFAALRLRLQREEIPFLLLELDSGAAALGQARTRIEAFLEML